MADAPNEPKADLKSRLGLKSRAAAPAPALPIVPGAPPPEPVKKAPERPTAETIAEARAKAVEAEKAAGPAVEAFQFVAPDKTPLPDKLPQAPQVMYVEVGGAEELPEVKRKRTLMIGALVAGAAIIAFILGRTLAGSAAMDDLREAIIAEAKEKQSFFASKQPTLDLITNFRGELEKIESQVRNLDPAKGDILDLETDLTGLLAAMNNFAGNSGAYINPAEAMGERIFNALLMRRVIGFAYDTKAFHEQVVLAIEEAKALFAASPIPPVERQSILFIAEPDTRDVEGLGPVPLSKGTIVVQPGPPQPFQGKDEAGNPVTKFQQKVRVEGREEPVQIETWQLVQADLQPFFNNMAKAAKRQVLMRLAVITNRLYEMAQRLDAKDVRAAIQEVLDKAATSP